MSKKRLLEMTALALAMLSAGSAAGDGGKVWSQYDADQDGYLSPDEFAEMRSRQPPRPEYEPIWQFERVDRNHDGRIDQGEMVGALQEQAKVKRRLQ